MKPLIVRIGEEKFNSLKDEEIVNFLDEKEINNFLNDLEHYPHAFILACLMDKQMKAETAWKIPYKIYQLLGTFDIYDLGKISLEEYINIFESNKLHRFNKGSAKIFYDAVHRIIDDFNGDVSLIWKGKPSSARVVYELLKFNGCGLKIATMTANILAREFRIEFSDYYSIDISTDVHINRVMRRMGFVPENADNTMVVYKARELNPEFPGIIDFSCWEIGRTYCRPQNPKCKECLVRGECKKQIN